MTPYLSFPFSLSLSLSPLIWTNWHAGGLWQTEAANVWCLARARLELSRASTLTSLCSTMSACQCQILPSKLETVWLCTSNINTSYSLLYCKHPTGTMNYHHYYIQTRPGRTKYEADQHSRAVLQVLSCLKELTPAELYVSPVWRSRLLQCSPSLLSVGEGSSGRAVSLSTFLSETTGEL